MKAEDQRFGENMRVFMVEDNISESEILEQLGYKKMELQKILGARAYISIEEEKRIADFFKRPLEDFFKFLSETRYEAAGCYECRGKFEKPENRQLIFDLFDMHCDVQEVLKESI